MKKISEPVVFFGSGPVAAEALKLILEDFNIEVVITKPKKRSRDAAPVLDVVSATGLRSLATSNKDELSTTFKSLSLKSRLAILVDFGIIVNQDIINYFPLGIINSHFSLLPEWRGADPITFSILSGQTTTGVSLMLLAASMDEGPLLAQDQIRITDDIDSPTITAQLIELSNKLLSKYVPQYVSGNLKPYPQPAGIKPTYSRKLDKKDGRIDWSKKAEEINREIRAFLIWPKSYTQIGGKEVIITKSHLAHRLGRAGDIRVLNNEIIAYCGEDALIIDRLKPAGKVEMDSRAFLAGYKSLLD